MSDNNDETLLSAEDLDDWSDGELDEETLKVVHTLDGRRLVEGKLDELRLRRETSDFDFDF